MPKKDILIENNTQDPLDALHSDMQDSPLGADEYKTVIEAAHTAHQERTLRPFSFLDGLRATRLLAQLPEDDTILRRLEAIEATHFNPAGIEKGYREGSAQIDDQTLYVPSTREVALLTAEHATAHRRDGKWKEQDDFVGSIALLTAEDFGTGALVTLGRQTGDPNWDMEHKFKEQMELVLRSQSCGQVAVHGCLRVTNDLMSSRSLDFQLGIGSNPSDATIEAAERILSSAEDLGLKGVVNTRFWNISNSPHPHLTRGEDGVPKTTLFAGGLPKTTRSYAERVIADQGTDQPAIQVELASTIRPQTGFAKKSKSPDQAATAANVLHEFMGAVTEATKRKA